MIAHFHPVSNYLVCGASSGIGLALLFEILQTPGEGMVFATHRRESSMTALKELEKEHPDRLKLLPLDATIEKDYEALAHEISRYVHTINAMVFFCPTGF